VVDNTGMSNGPSFTYNDKNQTTAIGSNSYTYSGPDQTERVQLNSTTGAYSGLGLSYETTWQSWWAEGKALSQEEVCTLVLAASEATRV
jgi:hypothetical protein